MSVTGQDKDADGATLATTLDKGWQYEFGNFVFDPDLHELGSDGEGTRLRPQAAALLQLLLANPGRIVTREEIRDSIWQPDMVVDFDLGISACIKQIRRLLGDNAQAPEYIETVPRCGYRIVASVRRIPKTTAGLHDGPAEQEHTPDKRKKEPGVRAPRRRQMLTVVSVFVLSLLGLVWLWSASETPRREVVAILPLDNYSISSKEADTLALTITERLIGKLGPAAPSRLAVIGKTSTIAYDGQNMTAAELGTRLGADYIVEGSIREIEEGWVASIHLIRCVDESYVWGKLVETDTADTNESARIITNELSGALSDTLVPEDEPNSRNIAVEGDQDD